MAACSIEGCDRKVKALKLCSTHYSAPQTRNECYVLDCSRPAFARKVCQPHYHQGLGAPSERERGRRCSIVDCDRPHFGKGLCASHYGQQRHRKFYKPIPPTPLEERFWPKVAKGEPGECWEWQASRQPKGYGTFQSGDPLNRRPLIASRVSWELTYGSPIPEGMFVMHLCDNPPCVNPAHLRLGTHAENMADMKAKGRNWRGGSKKKAE